MGSEKRQTKETWFRSWLSSWSNQGESSVSVSHFRWFGCFYPPPPNLRVKPSWYPRFRPVILQTMLQLLGSRPSNLQILQDFSSALEPDGIHFSIMGGVTFVQDLHDQSLALMSQPPPDIVLRWDTFIWVLLALLLAGNVHKKPLLFVHREHCSGYPG